MAELKVAVLGGGSWGTTVAALTTRNAPVTLWARNADTVDEINGEHTNRTYLPDAKLPESLRATHDIGEAVANADLVVMGIPSQNFRGVLEEASRHLRPWVPVVSLTKGLELDTRMRMTEIIAEVVPDHPIGVLTGPNLAREIMAGQAAAGVIAMASSPCSACSRAACSASTPTRTLSAANSAASSRTSSPSPSAWATVSAPATTPGRR
jgi:glycerol-3-phosphate dehydrogenase (NAD(P)+)